jgi:hypothetical protein
MISTIGDNIEQAEPHSHRAFVQQQEGDEDAALRELIESRRIRQGLGDKAATAVMVKLLGNLHLKRKQYHEARFAWEPALTLLD